MLKPRSFLFSLHMSPQSSHWLTAGRHRNPRPQPRTWPPARTENLGNAICCVNTVNTSVHWLSEKASFTPSARAVQQGPKHSKRKLWTYQILEGGTLSMGAPSRVQTPNRGPTSLETETGSPLQPNDPPSERPGLEKSWL